MLILVVIGLLTYLLSHILFTHLIIERSNLSCLSQRFKLIYLCSHLHTDTCVMWSQVESVFGEYKSTEFALVVF